MVFRDINYFCNLDKIVRLGKPYRGTSNVYPLGDRRYTHRHFVANEDGTYDIWHINLAQGVEARKGLRFGLFQRLLGVVHPDNSFEFYQAGNQSDNLILSEGLGMHVHQVSRLGGSVVEKGNFIHPVFKGLRVDLATGNAVTPYKVVVRKAKLPRAKAYYKRFTESIDVGLAMLESMTERGVTEVYTDLFRDLTTEEPSPYSDRQSWKTFSKTDKSLVAELFEKGHCVDALCLFTVLNNAPYPLMNEWTLRQIVSAGSIYMSARNKSFVSHLRPYIDLKLCDFMIRNAPIKDQAEMFEFYEAQPNKLSTSKWGMAITSQNKPVVRL